MVPKVFEPLKFDCTHIAQRHLNIKRFYLKETEIHFLINLARKYTGKTRRKSRENALFSFRTIFIWNWEKASQENLKLCFIKHHSPRKRKAFFSRIVRNNASFAAIKGSLQHMRRKKLVTQISN